MSEIGLTTDQRPFRAISLSASAFASASASLPCLRDTASFILPRYRKSHGTSHYTTIGLDY